MRGSAAKAIGSLYKGRHTGRHGRLAAVSFNGNKTITTGGGGAILSEDEELAARAKHLTTTAKVPHSWAFEHDAVGYNYRMPNLNAALGCAQLEILPSLLEEYGERQLGRAALYTSLGQLRYLSALSQVDVVIGNSSSGIIEAPFFGKVTVNVGDRQKGRLKAASVIDCPEERGEIARAIERALSPEFRDSLATVASPYGAGGASARIKETLKTFNLEGILMKPFHDLGHRRGCHLSGSASGCEAAEICSGSAR